MTTQFECGDNVVAVCDEGNVKGTILYVNNDTNRVVLVRKNGSIYTRKANHISRTGNQKSLWKKMLFQKEMKEKYGEE